MGMSLVRGRLFSEDEDRLHVAPVVVINEALAQKYFPGEDPIGKHLTFGMSHTTSPSPADSVRARGRSYHQIAAPTNPAITNRTITRLMPTSSFLGRQMVP